MKWYVIKKALLIIPSLLILSVTVFLLSKLAPGDQVESLVNLRGQPAQEFNTDLASPAYYLAARNLGIDKPLFYFNVRPVSFPDTFYRIVHPRKREIMKAWFAQSGHWPSVQAFSNRQEEFITRFLDLPDSIRSGQLSRSILLELKNSQGSPELNEVQNRIDRLEEKLEEAEYFSSTDTKETFVQLRMALKKMRSKAKAPAGWLPVIDWNGTDNQYHHWLFRALQLDLGISMIDARKVTHKLSSALFWTLIYVMIAYAISLIIAIPAGLTSAWYQNRWVERLISGTSFIFYAFPLFWLATLGVVFLTSAVYHPWLDLFAGPGLGPVRNDMGFWQKLGIATPHLILPALILSLHTAAGGIRIIRNSTLDELKSDYFITARAKGLSDLKVMVRHIFPNAMLPVITLLISGFPAALAGSVVLEVVFNIPGMGRLLYDSIKFMDWNVVFAILLFIGLITFVFYLIGDLLYAYLNPKIKFR